MMPSEMPTTLKFCPKCSSSSFKSMDGGRSYLCEDCKFQYYINNSAAVACLIFNSQGEVLLTRRAIDPNKGMLDLPGGFVEPLETAEEAVIREIKEELGLQITKMTYLVSFPNLYPFSDFVVPTVDLAFVCKTGNQAAIRPGDDVSSVEFIQPEKIDFNELCSESMKQIIRFYLSHPQIG